MRIRTVAVLGVLLAAVTAGCAKSEENGSGVASARSGGPTATSTATAADDGPDFDASLKYAKCMREQGLEWFPDPKADGRMEVQVPQSVDKDAMDKAEKACRQYLPNGGEPPKLSAEDLERERNLAKCMRANGVPNFPDPDPNGEVGIDAGQLGTGPGDPAWDAAEKACSQYFPEGATRSEKKETT